jgi:hypothetical protein
MMLVTNLWALNDGGDKPLQNPTSAAVFITATGTLTNIGYSGYITVRLSSASPTGFVNYTKNGNDPTCRPAVTLPPTTFILDYTAEVCTCPFLHGSLGWHIL